MPIEVLTLEKLALADPEITGEINAALELAARHVANCPGDERPRTVTIKLAFTPADAVRGRCDKAQLAIEVKTAFPSPQVKGLSLGIHAGDKFVLRVDSPDDVNQTTFRDLPDDQR